jgi:hypothetical protein
MFWITLCFLFCSTQVVEGRTFLVELEASAGYALAGDDQGMLEIELDI